MKYKNGGLKYSKRKKVVESFVYSKKLSDNCFVS